MADTLILRKVWDRKGGPRQVPGHSRGESFGYRAGFVHMLPDDKAHQDGHAVNRKRVRPSQISRSPGTRNRPWPWALATETQLLW